MSRAHSFLVDVSAPPAEPRRGVASWYTPGLSDGLGDRLLMFDNTSAASLEMLRFKPAFGEHPQFEHTLRERAGRLERFTHASIAPVRAVEWLSAEEGLALISNHVEGRRLSEVLHDARGPRFATELVRQVIPVLAALQRQGDLIAHGLLSPERIVVTPDGRLVLTEHVLGSAIQSLQLPAGRLRADFKLALPDQPDPIALDQRSDVIQAGIIALSLLLGRRIDPADYPEKGAGLIDECAWTGFRGSPVPARLLVWLERALQLSGRSFDSALEAEEALSDLPDDPQPQLADRPRRLYVLPTPAPAAFPAEDREETPAAPEAPPDVPATLAWPAAPALPAPAHLKVRPTAALTTLRWVVAGVAVLAAGEAIVISGLLRTKSAGPNTPPVADPQSAAGAPKPVDPAPAPVPGNISGPAAATTTPSVPPAVDKDTSQSNPVSAVPAGGRLEITSDPTGARVTIDGRSRGATPLAIPLAAGQHVVVLTDGASTTTRTVSVSPGGTATLMASLAPASAAAGWVTIKAPVEMQVREAGSLLGITSADRLMLPAGRHDLQLSSEPLGVQTSLPIDIPAAKTVIASVSLPMGSLSINALPWANVLLDGQPLSGATPFANLEVMLGTHEIVWKHPQLGERRQTVVVTAKAPLRVVMDFNK